VRASEVEVRGRCRAECRTSDVSAADLAFRAPGAIGRCIGRGEKLVEYRCSRPPDRWCSTQKPSGFSGRLPKRLPAARRPLPSGFDGRRRPGAYRDRAKVNAATSNPNTTIEAIRAILETLASERESEVRQSGQRPRLRHHQPGPCRARHDPPDVSRGAPDAVRSGGEPRGRGSYATPGHANWRAADEPVSERRACARRLRPHRVQARLETRRRR